MLAFGCFFLLYVFMLVGFAFIPEKAWNQPATANGGGPPPVIFFRIMAAIMAGLVFVGWTIGGLTAYAGRCIQKRKRKTLIYVMAALNCLFIPYGILLGIFTFIVLGSPAAAEEFRQT